MKKRIMALLLVTVMLISCVPSAAFAVTDTSGYTEPTIMVQDTIGEAGAEVQVNILIANNPGVAGAKFTVSYDEKLTLIGAVSGPAFSGLDYTKPGVFTSPCNFTWDSENAEVTQDGIILTLTFHVSEEAIANENLAVHLSTRYGDIYNSDLDSVAVNTADGYVQVLDYTPGDLNDDGTINGKDVTLARRVNAGGYNVDVRLEPANVNGDTIINGKDVTLIRRYNAGGYDVILLPSPPLCDHELEAVEEKAPTCTEDGHSAYWYCGLCKKCFTDAQCITVINQADTVLAATGHTLVTVPGYDPDYGVPGLSDGIACSICDYIEKEQTVIDPIPPNECYVSYNLAGTDEYLKSYLLGVDESTINPNPNTIDTTTEGYELKAIDLDAIPGYEFQGWVDGYGESVRTIVQGTEGTVKLVATWKKTEYHITFHSPLKPMEQRARTIDEAYYLPQDMEWDHYVFVGWSDNSGRIVDAVMPGTKDITVHANWTSNRNQAKANNYLEDGPIIIEDEAAKKYYFVYDLGMILNVPLELVLDLGYRSSLEIEETEEKTVVLEQTESENVNKIIENATTNSSSWTLSKDWNELLTNTTGGETEVKTGQVIALSTGMSQAYGSESETYVGASFHTSEDNLTTAKTVTDDSWKVSTEAEVSGGWGPVKASVSASAEKAHSTHQEDYTETQTSMSQDSTWNTTDSYSSSGSFTQQTDVTDSIEKSAKDTWKHEISKSIGGSDTQTTQGSVTNKVNDGYSSTMSYHSVDETVTVQKISSGADTTPGYYRYVLAGDYYVYAIVCYDVTTGAYSVNTHSVLSDNTRKFLDYSKNDPTYSDYNNGVLPFEIPIDVHNYIYDALAKTDGLIVDKDTGIVTGYDGDSKNVFIPDYAVFTNEDGALPDVVKVVGFNADVFAGKSVKKVRLGRYITEIPDNAFENCTALECVEYDTLTYIGEGAFRGCTALETFTVDDTVETLGMNAFDNAPAVIVNAKNSGIVTNAITSTAGAMTINLDKLTDMLSNVELDVKATESITINGYGKTYNAVHIISSADITVINRMTLADSTKIPLDLSSADVTLNQVKIEGADTFGMVLRRAETVLTLQGKISIATSGATAILAKNLTVLRKAGIIDATELNVDDKEVLICGAFRDDNSYLKTADGQIKYISEEEFENKLKSRTVTFDSTGGTVLEASRICEYGSKLGSLPVPTKDYCDFIGWYTDADGGGEQITEETVVTEDMTLYACWELKAASDWVKVSDLPDGAEVLARKWTYTLTTTTESKETSLEGYTQTDSRWVESGRGSQKYATFPSGFDTSHSIYKSYAKSALTGYENTTNKRVVSNKWSGYIYWHWMYDVTYSTSTDRRISSKYGYFNAEGGSTGSTAYLYQHFFAIASSVDCPYLDTGYCCNQGLPSYNCKDILPSDKTNIGTPRCFRFSYYTSSYVDYYKLFTYSKTEAKESLTQVTESSTISDVQEWVQYRAK